MKNFDRIKSCVENSALTSEDKRAVCEMFAEISDEHLEDIALLFEEKKNWIEFFNENRKKKLEASQSGDISQWEAILEEEKKILNKLVYDSD